MNRPCARHLDSGPWRIIRKRAVAMGTKVFYRAAYLADCRIADISNPDSTSERGGADWKLYNALRLAVGVPAGQHERGEWSVLALESFSGPVEMANEPTVIAQHWRSRTAS
jgi:hypothetical protein